MKPTILMIEDNEQNSYLMTYLLQHAGCEVVSAATGVEGLETANRISPTLILLDIQLPGMDGYEVAQKLRANPTLARVPIMAVTSYAMAGDREKVLAAGCTHYLEKPINPDSFADEVLRHVYEQRLKTEKEESYGEDDDRRG